MFYGMKLKVKGGKKELVATVSDKKEKNAQKEVSAEKLNRILIDLFA